MNSKLRLTAFTGVGLITAFIALAYVTSQSNIHSGAMDGSRLSYNASDSLAARKKADTGYRFVEGEITAVAGSISSTDKAQWQSRIASASSSALHSLMDEALDIADPELRVTVISELSVKWLQTDRSSLIAFLDEAYVRDATESADIWRRLLPALTDAFGKVDSATAASTGYGEAVQKLVGVWASSDLAAARTWVSQRLQGDARDQASVTMIRRTDDIQDAKAVLETIIQPYRRIEGTKELVSAMATADADAAYLWATSRTAGVERAVAVETALSVMAKRAPEQASQYLTQVLGDIDSEAYLALSNVSHGAPSSSRTELASVGSPQISIQESIEARRRGHLNRLADTAADIAYSLAETNPGAAQAWVETLPVGAIRTEAHQASLEGMASRDPAQAFASYLVDPGKDPKIVQTIFERWASSSPTVAAAQITSISDAAARTTALHGLVEGWAGTDRDAARSYVAGLAVGVDRDTALAAYSSVISGSDPQGAWNFAKQIDNSSQRDAVLSHVFTEALARSPSNARRLLDDTKVSRSVSTTMMRQLHGATVPGGSH